MPAATSGDAGHTRHRGAWLVVVSIGTQIRPQYWRAQRLTWAHGHPFLKFDESDALPCRECPSTLDRRYWWNPNASSSWWCAQKRPLQAIRAAGLRHPSASWFLLVDDDTWVSRCRNKPRAPFVVIRFADESIIFVKSVACLPKGPLVTLT